MAPELLAPAGNFEKLKYAVAYGADTVYFGSQFGSLRNFAGNFTDEQADEAIRHLHERGRKGYLTLNIYPFTDEYDLVRQTAGRYDEMGIDAIIVADMGVFNELRKMNLSAGLHISTQANTVSAAAALAYSELGAQRVNLARELTFEQVKDIREQTRGKIELEVFIHGAVCFSYSGRCAISDYMTGYPANRGQCKHPCRYKYYLVEEKRPGQYYPVAEDERGLYLFNCKDLALFSYIQELAGLDIDSLKIEGRMKSVHYIASVVSFYRRVLDGEKFTEQQAVEILSRVPNRGYTSGFMKGSFPAEDYTTGESITKSTCTFVGNVIDHPDYGTRVLEVRNKVYAGERLELLTPDGNFSQLTMPSPLRTTREEFVEFSNNSQFVVLETAVPEYSIVRRVH